MALVLGGCGAAEPPGTPLERGQWRIATHFATPKVDGLSIDVLRRRLPADTEKNECFTPVISSGQQLIKLFNLNQNACNLTGATVENGNVAAEGQCPSLAAKLAANGGGANYKVDGADSWVKISGTYDPRYVTLDAEVVMTLTTDRGETSRVVVNATHIAERTGDCS